MNNIRPQYYKLTVGESECELKDVMKGIDFEDYKGFCRMSAIKYTMRYKGKNGIEDLRKAKFYIEELIKLESKPIELCLGGE